MNTTSINLIEKLTQAAGLSGYERNITAIVQKELQSCGTVETDAIGNVLCTLPGKRSDAPVILFAAHQDEIGFIVSDILESGFLRIFNIGGWNTITLPSSPVEVINSHNEPIRGVIGQISPHFLKKGSLQQIPDLDELFVDIGASSAREVRDTFNIDIGSLVIPVSQFTHITQTNRLISKAFDDRIGIAALIELGKRLSITDHDATVVLAATVQEEVGERGAYVLANRVEADMAIVIEGAPADDVPGGPNHPQTCVGNGAHVRIFDPTHIGHPALLSHIKEIAHSSSIPIQLAVRKGGGTDAVALALAAKGIPTVVTGVPVRYAHSHNCLISVDDYVSLIDLLTAVCLKTNTGINCT